MNKCIALFLAVFFLTSSSLKGQNPVDTEESGEEKSTPETLPTRNPLARELAFLRLGTTGLLLIPESTNDRVMAFDAMTGDLIDPDFIPADPTNLSTPIHAILGLDGNSILVSDQLDDVVQSYDMDGNYLGVFAPAGGVDNNILDNIRGMSMGPSNSLLVTVGGGANDDAVAQFDDSGTNLGNFIANGAGGLDSPFDILANGDEYLVGGISSDAIHRFDSVGSFIADLAPLDTFPEQLALASNGNVLIGNFSGSQEGIVELSPAGAVVGVYDPPSLGGYRGVYELPNGNILTTNGGGVHEIDRNGVLVETKIAGVSARFISLLGPVITCDPVDIQVSIGGPIIVTGTPGCVFDLYDTGCVDDTNQWILIAAGLEIPDSGSLTIPNINGMADACYVATVSGDNSQILNAPVRTVPALSTWGLLGFAIILMIAALFFMKRKRALSV